MDNYNVDRILDTLRTALMTDSAICNPLPIRSAVDLYIADKTGVLSPNTMRDYQLTLSRFVNFIDESKLTTDITPADIRAFLNTIPGGRKNHLNAHIGLAAFWTYLVRENRALDHVVRRVEMAKPEQRAIIPFSREEAARMIQAVRYSGRDHLRNEAIILTLLDTGVRASELCGLRLADLEDNSIRVMGKGSKERQVPVTPKAMTAIVSYLEDRKAGKRTAPVFLSETRAPLTRDSLRLLIERIGARAKVNNAHAHKFRHTFAINYLLNGGDPYTLQMILGHSTMDMVKRYLYLTNKDVSAVHLRSSPLAKWNL